MKSILFLSFAIFSGSTFASGNFSNSDICKAAISSEMFRDVKTMKSQKSSNDQPEISYTRPDGDKFRYQCRFDGDKVVWRTYFNDKVQVGWGRWRNTDPNDSVLTYKISDGILEIHNSSFGSIKSFNKSDF